MYKIIKKLELNKAYGHDMISIRMIKLCGISICKPLEIIFQNCLRSGKFPSEWKKAKMVPTFKKCDKQCIKNYHKNYIKSYHKNHKKLLFTRFAVKCLNGYFIITCFQKTT